MSEPTAEQQKLLDARLCVERGDYAAARATARGLLATAVSDDVRKEAEEILSRLRPDRAAIYLTLGCLAFFLAVFYVYVLR